MTQPLSEQTITLVKATVPALEAHGCHCLLEHPLSRPRFRSPPVLRGGNRRGTTDARLSYGLVANRPDRRLPVGGCVIQRRWRVPSTSRPERQVAAHRVECSHYVQLSVVWRTNLEVRPAMEDVATGQTDHDEVTMTDRSWQLVDYGEAA